MPGKPHPYFNILNSIKLERTMSSCCPENSWGKLNNPGYKAKGIVEKIQETNIDVYRVGESEKCIIWNYDVFGFDGGRTRQMADFIADHGNVCCHINFYLIIMFSYDFEVTTILM